MIYLLDLLVVFDDLIFDHSSVTKVPGCHMDPLGYATPKIRPAAILIAADQFPQRQWSRRAPAQREPVPTAAGSSFRCDDFFSRKCLAYPCSSMFINVSGKNLGNSSKVCLYVFIVIYNNL